MSRGRATSGVVAAVVVIAVLALVAVLATWFYRLATRTTSEGCTAGSFDLTTDQAAIASSMVGVTIRRDLPERASVLVLAAALQESKLRNLPSGAGDRDSVGVLQQRPSQGWGTAAQLSDVRYATGKFLDALVKVPNWRTRPLAETIQAVQISADQESYTRHEPKAQALSDALTGTRAAGLDCRFGKPTKVAAAATVASQVARDLPVHSPTSTATTITVPGARWATAAWFVANANRLGIDRVDFNGHRWTRSGSWKTDHDAPTGAVVATLHH